MTRIHHVGMVVDDLDMVVERFIEAFAVRTLPLQGSVPLGLRIAFLAFANCQVEVVQPTEKQHPHAEWLARHGSGMHHIAIEVEDAEADFDRLSKESFASKYGCVTAGANNSRVVVFAADAFGGPLVHLVEAVRLA